MKNISIIDTITGYISGRIDTLSYLYLNKKEKRIDDWKKKVLIGHGTISFTYKGKPLFFCFRNEAEKIATLDTFCETFEMEPYRPLNVQDRTVIDAGSAIGETAIWLLANGARKVISYEILGEKCEMEKRNLKANVDNFPEWKGKWSEKAEVHNRPFDHSCLRIKYKGDAVLKLDIEGGEYELFEKATNEELRQFCEIIMEYHHGYRNITKKLVDSGFEIRMLTRPRFMGSQFEIPTEKSLWIGLIYAIRR